jgi:hypothetical protein
LHCTMAASELSHLQRVVQKLGLDAAIPNFQRASKDVLQAQLSEFLYLAECHGDLDISENFNPSALPEVAFREVMRPRRLSLMKPYFSTMSSREITALTSQDPSGVSLLDPPLDSDDFLGCRVFFRIMAQAVEQDKRIVVLNDGDHTLALVVHVKALRLLRANAEAVQKEAKETVLLEVEYFLFDLNNAELRERHEKILSDLCEKYPGEIGTPTKVRIALGTKNQIYFVMQVLQAHERHLHLVAITEHNREWKPRQKLIRPSFIVPLRTMEGVELREVSA